MTIEGGELDLASGLLLLIERALDGLAEGEEVLVASRDAGTEHDLPAWCRIAGHAYLGHEARADGATLHRLRRGAARRLNVRVVAPWGRDGPPPAPERADPRTGFSPRGAVLEEGAPAYPFGLVERERVWADEVTELYAQATRGQWDASRDIPWAELRPIAEPLERAVCQVMTFLVENELSALYVPGKFVPRIHPHYAEVVMFLATQMADEARHIEVFTRRAYANGGGLQYSAVSTQASLETLLLQEDFTAASFLLSVLGEGTFLDLLRFIEEHAPEPVTAEVARRARADEARHVRFGVAHVRYFLSGTPGRQGELEAAARLRAGALAGITTVNPFVQEALAVLAAGGLEPERIRSGVAAVRELLRTMHDNRVKRLVACGFASERAEAISTLHTPNFM